MDIYIYIYIKVILLAPMRAVKFQAQNGYNQDVIITVDPPPSKTPSGRPSYYNGLVVKYNSSSGYEGRLSGQSISQKHSSK